MVVMDQERMEAARIQMKLNSALLDKLYKTESSIMQLGDNDIQDIPRIPTGVPILDKNLGGGLPIGRVSELYGPDGSGKTTLAWSLIAEAQKMGKICAFVDVENAINPIYARNVGVKVEDLFISQPDSGEHALEITEMYIKDSYTDLVVVDSLAMIVPTEELEKNYTEGLTAAQPRLIGKFIRKVTAAVNKNDVCVLVLNQVRANLSPGAHGAETTPGGKSSRHLPSVRMKIRRTESLKKGDEVYGQRVRVDIIKSKVSNPYTAVEFDIKYGKGVDAMGSWVDMAVERNIIKKSGAWFSYNGTNLGQGKENTIINLASDLAVFDEIKELVLKDE